MIQLLGGVATYTMCGNLQDDVKVRQLFSLTSQSILDTNLGGKCLRLSWLEIKPENHWDTLFSNILHQHRPHQNRPDQNYPHYHHHFLQPSSRCCRYSASFLPSWRWSTVSCSLSFLWTRDSLLWYWGHYRDDGNEDFGEDNVDADGDEKLR